MKKKVHKTKNLEKILKVCELTQAFHWLTLLQGESGYGKTFGYKYFALKHTNVYVAEATSTDNTNPIGIWKRLAIEVLGEELYYKNCENRKFADVIDYLVAGLNAKDKSNLVVLDEGGFLSHSNLRHFRSLADRTKFSTGYILSGPEYSIEKIKAYIEEKVDGYKEIETRIDLISTLRAPDPKDKLKICEEEGISDKKAKLEIVSRSAEFRSLFRNIGYHKLGIPSRYESEWPKQIHEIQIPEY